jgi:hypothetical protein
VRDELAGVGVEGDVAPVGADHPVAAETVACPLGVTLTRVVSPVWRSTNTSVARWCRPGRGCRLE